MPVDQFANILELKTPFVASGEIDEEYEVIKAHVGVVQLGGKDGDLQIQAGAYGIGVPIFRHPSGGSKGWEMHLQPDAERPNLVPGPAVGFILVELSGGRMIGWVDNHVRLVDPTGAPQKTTRSSPLEVLN